MHRQIIIFIFICLIALISLKAYSATSTATIAQASCQNPITTVELNNCASELFEIADKRLDRVYRQVISQLNQEEKQKLAQVQQAWIKFRDRNCDFEALRLSTGSAYTMNYLGCLEEMTKQRSDTLEEYLKQP